MKTKMMQRLLLVLCLSALIVSCSYAGKRPVAVADVDSVCLGTVSYKTSRVVSYDLKLENHGEADLKIQDFRVDCDCTKAVADTTVIAPGESTTVHVTITFSLAKSAPFAKRLGIVTNDSLHSPLIVTFYGQQDYRPDVTAYPHYKKHDYEK